MSYEGIVYAAAGGIATPTAPAAAHRCSAGTTTSWRSGCKRRRSRNRHRHGFELPDHVRQVADTVRHFVREELLPFERMVIRREAERGLADTPTLPPEVSAALDEKARALGLWGIDVPAVYGGQDLGTLVNCVVTEALKYSMVPFVLRPDSPNLHYLQQCASVPQIERYLRPDAAGPKRSCLALTEAGAGSDAGAITMRAVRRGDQWVHNGSRIFISNAKASDFIITMAVNEAEGGERLGIGAFLFDAGTPLTIPGSYPTIGDSHPCEVHYDDVTVGNDRSVIARDLLGHGGAKRWHDVPRPT